MELSNVTIEAPKLTLPIHTLLLCNDVSFLGTTRGVLNQLQMTPKIASGCEEAVEMIHAHEFDVIVVDWREINNLGEFLSAVRGSKLNHESVVVAIVRDLLDLRQAFSAVHFLIHKPPSTLQIERCMRAAYSATVARRRKQHRERVNLPATASTRTQPYAEVTIVNLSQAGAGLQLRGAELASAVHGPVRLNVGEEIDVQFTVPSAEATIHASGLVVWSTPDSAGVRFKYIPHSERAPYQSWLSECVERSLRETCERVRAACA